MKKALFIIMAIATLSFTATSCAKSCKCTTTVNGTVTTTSTIDLDEGKKCSEYNASVTVLGQTGEVKCTPILF
jgi:hypothetical protein